MNPPRRRPRQLLAVVMALCACGPQAIAKGPDTASRTATQSAADRAAVMRLERRWVAALAPGGDRRALADILADDYLDIDWRGRIRHKADLIHAAASPQGALQHVTGLEVRVWGNSAVATGVNIVRVPAKGWTSKVAFTDVFVRRDGRWRAVSSQETLRKAPAAGAAS